MARSGVARGVSAAFPRTFIANFVANFVESRTGDPRAPLNRQPCKCRRRAALGASATRPSSRYSTGSPSPTPDAMPNSAGLFMAIERADQGSNAGFEGQLQRVHDIEYPADFVDEQLHASLVDDACEHPASLELVPGYVG